MALSTSRFYSSIEQFRIVQKRRDFFEVYLKMSSDIVDSELVDKELKAVLTSALKADELNLSFNVNFVDDIPLSKTGRLSAVYSEVN